jgi:hypothetical protein
MKTNTHQPIQKMAREELQQLCIEVKETLATGADLKNLKHHFGVADLWNIQRTTRYRVQRRHMIP